MPPPFFFSGLRALLFGALTSTAFAQEPASGAPLSPRPVVAYLAPADVFPSEGGTAGSTPATMPVYEAPGGAAVGVVRPSRAAWCAPADVCPFDYHLTLNRGAHTQLEPVMWAYDTFGFPTFDRPQRDSAGRTWASLDTALGRFWVRVGPQDIKWFTDLVHVVEGQQAWCRDTRRCAPVSPAMAEEMARVALASTCFSSPYEVSEVVPGAKGPLYRLELPALPEGVSTWLPRQMLTPVFGPNGAHTGTFYPKGC